MSVSVETATGFRFATRGFLLGADSDRMTAWAEKHVHRDPDLAWVLGNFVEADNANSNGHIFTLGDLTETAVHTVAHKPLNMLHHENYIIGAYAGAEMIHPGPAAATETADEENGHPYMEALAAMWRHIYPNEHRALEKAQKEGTLFFSMEASAESLTFVDFNNLTLPYMGRYHDSYPTKDPRTPRVLNKPHFGAGAIIIPPVRPGWNKADVKALDSFITDQPSAAEAVYAGLVDEFPHLDQSRWETMMGQLLGLALDR